MPASFSSSTARAIFTTSAIFTCASAPADAFPAARAERRRMPGLTNHAVRAGRVDAAKDRAEVVRILDAVEHDEQRRRRRVRVANQIVEIVNPRDR